MKTALIVGMAKSGIAAAKLLYKEGYKVIVNDMKPEIAGLKDALDGTDCEWRLGEEPEALLDGVDLIIPSPVIPMTKPFIVKAQSMGIEVISEIELGYRYSHAEFVCITGTNGKTTCTALTGEIFKAAGFNTFVLGNIGVAICEHALDTRSGDVIVAETAALQLEGNVDFHAHIAGVCNITPDHLDHFGSMERYIACKAMILKNQTADDFAVLNYDDPIVRDFHKLTPAKALYFSRKSVPPRGMYLDEKGDVVYDLDGRRGVLIKASEIRIPGAHNLENAMLCALCAMARGIAPEVIAKVLREFGGVEHRIEYICTRGGVDYINDSKGTNVDSTIRAIQTMTKPTVLILGGYDKHVSFDELFKGFTPNIKACVLLGATKNQLLETARRFGYGDVCHMTESFREAMDTAKSLAKSGETVLLSPACASWGMFQNFEQRGEIFAKIAREYKD